MSVRRSRSVFTLVCAAALVAPVAAQASGPPPGQPTDRFGTDSDDPQIPDPPVDRPAGEPTCSIEILQHDFDDYSVQERDFDIPAECGDEWAAAVLTLEGSVAGVQYDRAGWIQIDDATVMRLSTPEPSKDGISWRVEQDLTAYQDVLDPGTNSVAMYLGNTVNETYTGIFDITLTLDLYAGPAPEGTPEEVITFGDAGKDGADLVHDVTMPRNSTKIVGEVYAIGSGGGCEEFWDTSAPAEAGTWCPDGHPYREVQVLIDGELAGTALPYAVVYTGGWSNPYMWMPTPSPYAFNIPSLQYDLTPFAGLLNDGMPHEVRFHVVGNPPGASGWSLMPNLFAWTDDSVEVIEGEVTRTGTDALVRDETLEGNAAEGGHTTGHNTQHMTTAGWLDLPSGRVETTVTRDLVWDSMHSWTAGEMREDIDEASVDTETVLQTKVNAQGKRGPGTERTRTVEWSKAGYSNYEELDSPAGALQIYTELDLSHATTETEARVNPHGKRNVVDSTSWTNTYDGWGDWTAGVPRDERVATAASTATFTVTGKNGKPTYSKTLVSKNGWYVD